MEEEREPGALYFPLSSVTDLLYDFRMLSLPFFLGHWRMCSSTNTNALSICAVPTCGGSQFIGGL